MPKINIEENTENEPEKIVENKIEEPKLEKPIEDKKEKPIEEVKEIGLALDSIKFKILRVDYNGIFGADENGNGMDIPIPKQYKNKELKAGDTIFVSKSEL
jgi:hypothetical protein